VKKSEASTLGTLMKKFRQDAGMNQAKLAERAGLSPAYISELEGGTATRPSGQVLLQLANALGVTIADLLDKKPTGPEVPSEIPESLAEFARLRKLKRPDIEMLASIRFRGEPPKTARRWEIIYDTIRMSSQIDEEFG
jgi:transcriptional regulator with XRE-family HTH domain